MEYFKNVLLRLYETGEAESLLPVVAQLLQFSPGEVARCRDALKHRAGHLAGAEASEWWQRGRAGVCLGGGAGQGDGAAAVWQGPMMPRPAFRRCVLQPARSWQATGWARGSSDGQRQLH